MTICLIVRLLVRRVMVRVGLWTVNRLENSMLMEVHRFDVMLIIESMVKLVVSL